MKLFVTILEETLEATRAAIARLSLDHDGVEVRAEKLGTIDFAQLRAATDKPLILTYRGRSIEPATIAAALAAGIDLVDVEYRPELDPQAIAPFASRVVLSHHDFEGFPDVAAIIAEMRRFGTAHVKLAVSPSTLDENLALLRCLEPGMTAIGMGERGLYSRILAPFLGSELAFVAPDDEHAAAPGQVTLERALAIYGTDRASLRAEHVFAIAGNPAGHSRSPLIHNALFREKGVSAAYTVASVASFDEIAAALDRRDLHGVSVTAPFKEDAFRFATIRGAALADNARECGAVNTLVRTPEGFLADNTDVDGFAAILRQVCGRERKSVAIVGAGGTARAAAVALRREQMHVTIFNRSATRGEALASEFEMNAAPVGELARFDGEVVINTLPPDAPVELPLRAGSAYIEAPYGPAHLRERCAELARRGVQVFSGLDLLEAQAVRQNEIFVRSLNGL